MRKIYIYETPQSRALGLIKIGDTAGDVDRRIQNQLRTASTIDASTLEYTLLHTTPAVRDDGTPFRDHDVHKALEHKGYYNYQITDGNEVRKSSTEWFEISLEKVVHLIEEIKRGKQIEEIEVDRIKDFPMRPEQKQAVDKTESYFNTRRGKQTLEMLWNAKMRFGKTFAAYQLSRQMGLKKTLILTYKPAVEDAWSKDLNEHVDFSDHVFLSRDGLYRIDEHLKQGRSVVAFASYQDLLGKGAEGEEIKDRHERVFGLHWDLVIIDEFHYGTSTKKAKEILAEEVEIEKGTKKDFIELASNLYAEEDDLVAEALDSEKVDEVAKAITSDFRLYLSGTPFKAMSDGRFPQEAIYNWTYADEQRAKEAWARNHPDKPNPYAGLPKIELYLYKVSTDLIKAGLREGKDEFSLNHFFRANKKNKFENTQAVKKWLNLISGVIRPHEVIEDEITGEVEIQASQYPFDHEGRLFAELDHTLWYLQRVSSAYALRDMLKRHPVFSQFHIILAAGKELGAGLDAVAPVRDAIRRHPKTITISVGKLTTGVSIPEWKAVMFLRDINSPENYFQTAFRAQTPFTDPSTGKRKETCYIFDFSPNRSLRLLTTYSEKLSSDNHLTSSEQKISEFIRYLPVLRVTGNQMVEMDARDVLTFDMTGVDAKGLGLRFVERRNVVVNAQTVDAINASPETQARCQAIFDSIKKFRKYNGASDKEMSDVDVEVANLDANEKKIKKLATKKPGSEKERKRQEKEMNEAEKESKSEREKMRELLRTLLSRLPIFMYLTDATEENLEQVLIDNEDDLFRKATGITVDDFRYLVELGLLRIDSIDSYILRFIQLENQNYEIVNSMEAATAEEVGL